MALLLSSSLDMCWKFLVVPVIEISIPVKVDIPASRVTCVQTEYLINPRDEVAIFRKP